MSEHSWVGSKEEGRQLGGGECLSKGLGGGKVWWRGLWGGECTLQNPEVHDTHCFMK